MQYPLGINVQAIDTLNHLIYTSSCAVRFIFSCGLTVAYFYRSQGNPRANKPLSRRCIPVLTQADLRYLILPYLYHASLSLYMWSNLQDRTTYYEPQGARLVYAETSQLWLRRSKSESSSPTMRSLWRNAGKRYITPKSLRYIIVIYLFLFRLGAASAIP